MRNLVCLFILLLFSSCSKNQDENNIFSSNDIYKTVIKSVDITNNSISKKDSIFYVFTRYDTLIIMSSEQEDILKPTQTIKKEGYFRYKKNKIIVTQPYKPKFKILKESNKLIPIKDYEGRYPYYDGKDYQKGLIYKIKDLNHLELIDKGHLTKYFYPIKEYEIPMPPSPKKH
ncbi:hypothetical protein J2810_002777 [Chryseobacterium rhizosphaerae]|uniref:hypothetical protein n=1 Tax=Chryseobacterium rhizosphaerae TaxID=395937 RepID=UPI002858BC30|nr:hypothetical protein [Chryseobacterium rhizosphaerae]MDR6546671.1 hypothetical protein [Chryseobacterium rhizosphaerae]MDR6546717.1 hypothetical protein [Chryseobacterium rhizosphaerae]